MKKKCSDLTPLTISSLTRGASSANDIIGQDKKEKVNFIDDLLSNSDIE